MVDGPAEQRSDARLARESPLADVPPDAAILVTGPPMTGKYHLLLQLLGLHVDAAVIVSTKHRAERVIDDYRSLAGDVPEDRIGVVDCVSHHEAVEDVADTPLIKYASSPENLTRIGVKFTELYERFYDSSPGHVGVGIHSLSQLLMHSEMRKVYQFLQVLTGQVRSAGWLGVAVIDDSVADDEQMQTLQHHFDGIVHTRENDAGRREFRIRGLGPTASEWTTF